MRNPRNEPLADHDIAKAGRRGDAPERRCILSGRTESCGGLVRLALSPEGEVLPDALARAPGRGAWIGASHAELAAAQADGKLKAALSRAFKTGGIAIPDDLPAQVEKALLRAFLDRLGLELRFGHLILGSDRIAGEARKGAVHALYHAADASEDGARKLDQAWRVGSEAEGTSLAGVRLPLDRKALSVALGRDNVVHLALADRASAERVSTPLQRLLNFSGAGDAACGAAGPTAVGAASADASTV